MFYNVTIYNLDNIKYPRQTCKKFRIDSCTQNTLLAFE